MEQHERAAFSLLVAGKEVRVTFDLGRLASDAGVPLLAKIERRLGIAACPAHCIEFLRSTERMHPCSIGCTDDRVRITFNSSSSGGVGQPRITGRKH